MEFKKKTLETQIIEIFQKISPAITRLIQSATNNDKIEINGKVYNKKTDEYVHGNIIESFKKHKDIGIKLAESILSKI